LNCNDTRSTEFTGSLVSDLGRFSPEILLLEGSSRIAARLSLKVSGRFFLGAAAVSPFYPLRQDGYAKLRLEFYL